MTTPKQLTPKQTLLAHLNSRPHGRDKWDTKITLPNLIKWHDYYHQNRHLDHAHAKDGDVTYMEVVRISLAPPKNPGSNSAMDRNWVINIANMTRGTGWRYPIPGTRAGDPEGAQAEANKVLGWEAEWTPKGWGFEVKA